MARAVRRDAPTAPASTVTHRRCTGTLGCGALLEYVNGNPVGHVPGCEWKERSLAYNLDLRARMGEADRLRSTATQEESAMATNGKVQTVAFAHTTSGERVAAKKMNGNRATPKPKPHAVSDIDQAATEQAAVKAWERGGKKGPRPDTSTYDRLTAPAKGTTSAERERTATKAAASKRPAKAATGVRYTRNGEPVRDSMNRLSTLAYFITAGIAGPKSPRVGAAEFRAVLSQLGVEDPEGTTWDVVLPNGQRVGATQPGDKPAPAAKAAPAKKQPAKRASVMKAPAKRATPKATTSATTAARKSQAAARAKVGAAGKAKLPVRTKARPDGTPIPKTGKRK